MTAHAAEFEEIFAGPPLMAILRGMGVEKSLTVAETAWSLGIASVEVPLQTPEDEVALREVAARGRERGKSVGAGTIVAAEQVDRAVAAGASYLVSPGFDPALARLAADRGVPLLPGVATPTEVQLALAHGVSWLKAFPARWLGCEWFSLIRGPFPQVRFVATGGLDAGNVGAFLDAGVRVAAVGSALEDPRQLPALAALIEQRAPRVPGGQRTDPAPGDQGE
ncbi:MULTISPECIES: bifunctional 4-hydroxy-2-oxoglutarate aldolase/2-dehydro-3-deoxy-phosphogluconate aldolase [unclassified Microbacterium]|uniref:bifunctional 4-hydroxy-2-oxoglutarate aldolase/2-dehydro-3-deoxy-phosphogluconate aldolase n=1 Tax=unclassified Microbacterium TaxID=2609290 RepID=UPI003019EBDC